jgi:methylmalonyl-CoA/ethylmalonyl-CoA epimerase
MERFHHLAIVVNDIHASLDWYCKIYQCIRINELYIDENQQVRVQFIGSKSIKIELLEPLNEGSPICKFLDSHGNGSLYHIAYEVDDLDKKEVEIRKNGGIVISRTKNGWSGMEIIFAFYFDNDEKQLIEYVKL